MAGAPTLLFGAFDRHNLGDLLFPHVVARLLTGRELVFAGLAARDLRPFGGHRVLALASLAQELGDAPVELIHVGGELLGCDAWQAAVMLLPPDEAPGVIARLDTDPVARRDWPASYLGNADRAPYAVTRALFPAAVRVSYNAVGGVELGEHDAAFRDEVLAKLAAADFVSVREQETQAQLAEAGIAAALLPDPAVMVAELFGELIAQHAQRGEVADLRAAFPQGYFALQFAAEFGDDRSLDLLAGQLAELARATGLGLVLFRAGAAPWHDDLAAYERLAGRLWRGALRLFRGLDLWDLCALIAASRGYCGSSLHGRIVATAYALPRVNLKFPAGAGGPAKQAAYAAAWESPGMPGVVGVAQLAAACQAALATDPAARAQTAKELAERYRRDFAARYQRRLSAD